ncbi:site-specific DNA-methyltransferase, partial [Bathymodiolus thermophilus thioautotrophic gill symbiont]
FIYPRLKLARDLLTDDGVIFISIDDNEQANLKILCDEIFGEDNFLCTFPRVTKKGGKSSNDLSKNHDNLLSYSKSKDSVLNSLFHIDKGFKNEDEFLEVRGKYKLNQTLDYDSIQYSKSLDYEIEIDGKIFRPGGVSKEKMLQRIKTSPKNDFCWRWSKKLFEFGLKNGFVVVKNRIYTKTYLNVKIEKQKDDYVIKHEERTKAISTIEFLDTKYSNDNAKKSLAKLKMGTIFDYPKGTEFLKKITKTGSNENDIILDFFAGSGTTADAVIQLNAEDGGNRKFVLVQIDEPIDEKKSAEAYQFCTDNQFKPIISSITIERLNRAGEKIKKDLSSKQCPDIGYKVFSCTPKPQVGGNGIFKVENNRNNVLDTLINMLVATCKTLDTKIECLIKNKLYQADNEIYLLANVDSKVLEKYQDVKINLDGWADIDLTQYLNLGIGQADNISVIY